MRRGRSSIRSQAISVVLTLMFTGCGTLQRGPLQRVRVDSDPPGATVATERCGLRPDPPPTTPATIWISRRAKECTIRVSKDGYLPVASRLERRLDPVYDFDSGSTEVNSLEEFVGILFLWTAGLLVSSAVDGVSGAMFVVEPSQLFVTLEEEPRDTDAADIPQ